MTRKTQSTLQPRQTLTAAPPASISNPSKSILRPVSDPSPDASVYARTAGKTCRGPFSSLTFAAGTAFTGGGRTKKSRKGVLGFFQQHKKEGSDASSLGYASSGFDTSSVTSNSSGLQTPTSSTFVNIDARHPPKGSMGRGLWGRLTGTVREQKSSMTSAKAKPIGTTKRNASATDRSSVSMTGSRSNAPPIPTKQSSSTTTGAAPDRSAPPKTLSTVFQPGVRQPARADKPRTLGSTGPLSRPPLGNIFLGPLSMSPDRRPTSLDRATHPEMTLDGLEAVVASGFESVRVRSKLRAEPHTRLRPSADVIVAPALRDDEARQRSLSVINKANRTLLDLVARLDECPPSPEASPVKSSTADPTPSFALAPRKTATAASSLGQPKVVSAQSLLFLRKPKSAGRRLVPKASRLQAPLPELPPAVSVVMEKAGVDFVPGAAPIGFGQTVGAEQVVQSSSDVDSDDEPAQPGSDVPKDLLDIISELEDGSSRGSACWSDHAATPPLPILGLPLPPPPNRVSPRRNGLTLEVPPLRITSWHSRSLKSSDDTSAFASPNGRDSATFDFTGEIKQLNENARASFFDTLPSGVDLAPVFSSLGNQAVLAEADTGVVNLKSSKASSASSGASTPLGALNRDFRLGLRPPSHSPPPKPSFESPIFRFSAPTPLPPGSPTLGESIVNTTQCTTLGTGDSSAVSAEELEAGDILPNELFDESKRYSYLSDSSTTRRGHRRTGHGDSAASFTSFGSISSVGQVIHPGSRHPFSFDYSHSFADDSLSPDETVDFGNSSRTRTKSDISVLTQSSFGAPLVDGHRMSALFEFSSYRNGHSAGFSRHGYNDSISSITSTFSFHAPLTAGAGLVRRRTSSTASTAESAEVSSVAVTGPPISLFNQTRPYKWKGQRHVRSGSTDSALSLRSSVSRIPRATGRPDWARHRAQQSSADSSFSSSIGARPGLGDRMFSPDQAVPLFPISASPQGSPDDSFRSDSFQLERMLHETEGVTNSDSSDSVSADECRTSIDSGFPTYRFVHERVPSLSGSTDSVFGAGDDSFLRPFHPKGRPLSGVSMLSSDGDADPENDTFAFKRTTWPEQLELQLPIPNQASSQERPVSALSTGTSEVEFDDTFAFRNDGEVKAVEPSQYTLPVLRAEIKPRLPPPSSPLRNKRKDERDDVGRARKARLVSTGAEVPFQTQGLKERLSLEDSCLTAEGQDASFNSSDLAHFCQAFHISAPSEIMAKPRAPTSRKRAATGQKRPPTLVFSQKASVVSHPSSDSTATEPSRLSLDLRQLSLDPSAPSQIGTVHKPKFVPGHRSRLSGPSASVLVHETIHEDEPYEAPTGTGTPGLARSTASSPLSDAYDFPSPIFLLSREPDIVAFDDDPNSFEAIRGWRTWERDAQYEYGRSQATWADSDFSAEELLRFTPPTKLSQVQAFVQESTRSYKRLSNSFLKHKRSSSLVDARLHASPYYVAPEPAVIQAKPNMRSGKPRPKSIKTKFAGDSLEAQPESARLTSAKFAAFAPLPPATAPSVTFRPSSPPPSLAIFAPLSPLKISIMTDQPVASTNVPKPSSGESLAKKTRRVSSDVRRERLGWGRRKTSVDHGELAAVKAKRSSLQVQRDAPSIFTKLRPASLDNKENIVGSSGPPSARQRASRFTGSATHRAGPLRA